MIQSIQEGWNFNDKCKISFPLHHAGLFLQKIGLGNIFLEKYFMEDPFMDSCPVVDIPILKSDDQQQNILESVTCILMYRLKFLQRRVGQGEKDEYTYVTQDVYTNIIYNICQIYGKITKYMQDTKTVKILCFFLLHCSRTFLDPQAKSIMNAITLSNNAYLNINPEVLLSLKDLSQKHANLYQIIEKTNNFLIEVILESQRFNLALNTFKEKYNIEQSNKELIDHLKTLIQQIIFLDSPTFQGMVGQNQVYLSITNLELASNDQHTKFQYIHVIIHEFGHILLRQFILGNYLGSSPQGNQDIQKKRGGFDFQEILFGAILMKFYQGIITENYWNGQQPLLNERQIIKNMELAEQNYNLRFSGVSFLITNSSYM